VIQGEGNSRVIIRSDEMKEILNGFLGVLAWA
jgi:hypothetical protein